jgi:hypothetical protein
MAPPRIADRQNIAPGIHADDIETIFNVAMGIVIDLTFIIDFKRVKIIENRAGLPEGDALMIPRVGCRLDIIPLKPIIPHNYGLAV